MAAKLIGTRPRGATRAGKPKTRRLTRRKTANVVASSVIAAGLGARTEYRIYPSIGIARVGDSKSGFIVGPEAPGVPPQGPFRGKDDGIRPQAVRFRIYRVDIDANQNETVVGEMTGAKDVQIEWTVQLANRKAAVQQIFGDGSGTLTRNQAAKLRNAGFDRAPLVIAAAASIKGVRGTNATRMTGSIAFVKAKKVQNRIDDIELATIRTDDAGRLLVVGGPGTAGSPTNAKIGSFSDNDGWYDSVSDGPVSATLRIGTRSLPVIPRMGGNQRAALCTGRIRDGDVVRPGAQHGPVERGWNVRSAAHDVLSPERLSHPQARGWPRCGPLYRAWPRPELPHFATADREISERRRRAKVPARHPHAPQHRSEKLSGAA